MHSYDHQGGPNVAIPASDEEVGDNHIPYLDNNVNLGEILNDPNLQRPLYTNSTCTLLMVVILISTFVTKYSLTKEAHQDLLNIMDLILPGCSILPKTIYLFKKLIPVLPFTFKYFCPLCSNLFKDSNAILKCPCSDSTYSRKYLVEKNCYFLHIPIISQLKRILEGCKMGQFISKQNNTDLCDITDGNAYKTFGGGKLIRDLLALSLQLNTDGVPLFNSSGGCFWPIICAINELPIYLRKKYLLLIGLWSGPGKPNDIRPVLRCFVDEIKYLSIHGFEWILNGNPVNSTVDLCCVCVDSVARALMQCFLQFNGFFGCSWCENPGETCDGRHVYKFEDVLDLKTKEKVRDYANRAVHFSHPIRGVKGFSILSELPLFNIVTGCVFDVLHAVDLGVMRQLDALLFNTRNSECEWYLGKPETIEILNRKLRNIVPPSNVRRLPRTFASRAFWKGSEWRNMLLFYGPFILKDVMDKKYYDHFLLLSEAIYLLIQKRVTHLEVYQARKKLKEFVKRFEKLYGLKNMSFNLHQLLHACDCVGDWGPLWAYSLYYFEGENGSFLNMFNGTQSVPIQITNRFQQFQTLETLTNILNSYEPNPELESFLRIQNKLLGSYVKTKKLIKIEGITLIGSGKYHTLSVQELNTVSNLNLGNRGLCFSRFLFNNDLFTVDSYKVNGRRQNCFVSTDEDILYQISACLLLKSTVNGDSMPLILGYPLEVTVIVPNALKKQLVTVSNIGPLSIIAPNSIVSKCVVLHKSPLYLSVLPNLIDRD